MSNSSRARRKDVSAFKAHTGDECLRDREPAAINPPVKSAERSAAW